MLYVLARARLLHDQERLLQDLGPIHLIKYVYLADFVRWSITSAEEAEALVEETSNELPTSVRIKLDQEIRRNGNVTEDLLHEVYLTEPMLHAAPGEYLDLALVTKQPEPAGPRSREPMRPKAKKRRAEAIRKAKARLAEKHRALKEQEAATNKQESPRYDEMYFQGLEWLDSLAGQELPESGEIEFDNSIWKSPARTSSFDE